MIHKPGIEELEEGERYEKVLSLPYDGLAPFVINNLWKPFLPVILMWITAAVAFFLSVWYWPGLRHVQENMQILKGLFMGLILLPVILIPVHEGSHLIPFILVGAKDIRFGADLHQGIIYVTAHRFVAGRKLYALIALAPFIIITASTIILMTFCPQWWKWVLSMTLLAHTTMCTGDAALLGYMISLGKRKVYTWDDADNKTAYFYASVNNTNNQEDRQ